MAEERVAAEIPGTPEFRAVRMVIIGLMLGLMLSSLDFVIVAAAMRTIADQLHGQTVQAWATTAYMVTSTIATPLFGKLSDLYGRKKLYMVAIGIFLVGSLLCGLAGSMYQLAAYRALQGIGGGGLTALAFAIMGDILTPELRARYQVWFSAVSAIAGVAGAPIGGLFAGTDTMLGVDGWRWAFLINLPIGIVALVVVHFKFTMPGKRREQRIDYGGAAWLIVCLGPWLVVSEQGRHWGWGSPLTLSLLVIGLVGLVLFLATERRMADAAVIPLRLFRNRMFTVINGANVIVGIGVFGSLIFLPLYLQLVKGQSPGEAGVMLILQTVGVLTTSRGLSKVINRSGRYRAFLLLGMGAVAGTLFAFASLDQNSPLWLVGTLIYLLGAGVGVCFPVTLLALQNNSAKEDMGVSSAAYSFFRGIGGAAGTALFLSMMFFLADSRISEAVAKVSRNAEFQSALNDPAVLADPANLPVLETVKGTGGINLDDTSFLLTADRRLTAPVVDGIAEAMSAVFLAGGCVMLIGFGLAFLLPGRAKETEAAPARVQESEAAAS
ncbi:MDR family MFS transporter [Streptomyces scabiei]|uniref:MDR family MFS transporter n=1 Tax=Streptomyces scabiei TaxID=1930 RepID=UPI00298F8A21|nr:MDR family MFS transporter [Streptomyces scabiei]MDW8805235.1 MDR family MFS transporter [Streptomyces scabiei]